MSLRALTFTRQMATIENALSRPWGGRDQADLQDPVEQRYAECYPGIPRQPGTIATDRGIAQEMILRRREAHTLDALEELITYLRDAREERKAVLIITNGWRLYRPNDNLRRSVRDEVPSAPQVAVDPRSGRLTTEPTGTASRANACESDRLSLASLDHETRFRRLLDQANRANVSFYPVDPRGIVAFDDDILPVAGVGQNPVLSPDQERSRLEERGGSLHTMAERTDGVAVVATNDFALGLRRMITDLSAYYLLGYYSTGKLDGNFHAITVRVTRPGVEVRARRGLPRRHNGLSTGTARVSGECSWRRRGASDRRGVRIARPFRARGDTAHSGGSWTGIREFAIDFGRRRGSTHRDH
jgi:VWFA-related protein